jgi:penicillin G amidase
MMPATAGGHMIDQRLVAPANRYRPRGQKETDGMTPSLTPDGLKVALPELTGTLHLKGLEGAVDIYRDRLGIPHVFARSVHDAFFAQGFVHAQDRLWQMDYDRHRAYGRWAEYAGASAVTQDVLFRRFRLQASAKADYAAVNAETRAMFDAYAAGVNAFLHSTTRLPIEYQLVNATPEPWQPWDACAVFKVRHIHMGVWQMKLWRARLLRHLGPELTAKLCEGYQTGQPLIVPPGVDFSGPVLNGLKALQEGEGALAFLSELGAGSNSWAVSGRRTTTGRPLMAGDPHRALETPNIYYQNHVACPDFDVIGLSFAGIPGFPHFGHNQAVAWCVTHAFTDYQDLYIERFNPDNPRQYEFRGAWREAARYSEVIQVRNGAPQAIEVTVTHHGPVILGDLAQGYALAFRYTATAEPNTGYHALLPMLKAQSADDLEESMRPWVDPGNNFLFADVHGNIGYLTRGQVPLRSMANAWLPVPGWTGAHEWQGMIPFAELPRLRNPAAGCIVTANNRLVGDEYPYHLGIDYFPGYRARRILDRLEALTHIDAPAMAAIHADRLSIPGRELAQLLARVEPQDALSAQAKALLQQWDGRMEADSVAATIYAVCREFLLRSVMEPRLGPLAREAFGRELSGGVIFMAHFKARLTTLIQENDRSLLPADTEWDTLLAQALAQASDWLRQALGDDPHAWQWGRIHRTAPQHTLAGAFPDCAQLLNPPSHAMGGDGDTVQAASFIPGAGYALSSTSVARYLFDLDDWQRSAWVVPLGSSGHPGSPHYADQSATWAQLELQPMLYDWQRIQSEAETTQRLEPPV